MATFEKLSNGKIIYTDDKGRDYAFDARDRIVPSSSDNNVVLICSDPVAVSKQSGFPFKYQDITIPNSGTRNAMIRALATDYFDGSIGGVETQDVAIVDPSVTLEATQLQILIAQQNTLTEIQSILAKLNDSINVNSIRGGISPLLVISQYYKDSLGSELMNRDFSVVQEDFFIEVPVGEVWYIERLLPIIQDGNRQFRAIDFGAIAGGLTNGIQLGVVVNGVTGFFEDLIWKANIDLSLTMFDFVDNFRDGSGVGRWTLTKDTGRPIKLEAGDRQFFRMRDDLSLLTDFRIISRGWKQIL